MNEPIPASPVLNPEQTDVPPETQSSDDELSNDLAAGDYWAEILASFRL